MVLDGIVFLLEVFFFINFYLIIIVFLKSHDAMVTVFKKKNFRTYGYYLINNFSLLYLKVHAYVRTYLLAVIGYPKALSGHKALGTLSTTRDVLQF